MQKILCNISVNNNQHVVQVALNQSVRLDQETKNQISTLVGRCVEEAQNSHVDLQTIKSISIQSLNSGHLRYDYETQEGLQNRRVTIRQGDRQVQEGIRVNLSGPIQMRHRTLPEIREAFLAKWPNRVPIISFLWQGLIRPLVHIVHALHPGHVLDSKGMTLFKDPHGEGTLISALQEVRRNVFTENHDPIGRLIDRAILADHEWKASQNNDQSRVELGIEWSGVIRENFQRANRNARTPVLMIPTGYRDDQGNFQPLLATFWREGDTLGLTIAGYGEKGERSFHFECENYHPGQFLNEALFDLMDPERDGPPRGFKAMAEGENRPHRPHVSENPFLLIQETLRQTAPDFPLSLKSEFTYSLLEKHVETVLHNLDRVSPFERLKLLQQLEERCESLERQFRKAGKAEDQNERFYNLLQRLRTAVLAESQSDRTLEERAAGLNQPVSKISEPFALVLSSTRAGVGEARAAAAQSGELTIQDLDRVSRLKAVMLQPTQENVLEAVELWSALKVRCDELVDGRSYPAAVELYHLVMGAIPPPNYPKGELENDFWGVLDARLAAAARGENPLPNNQRPFDLYREVSTTIERFSHYFWEAKVQMNHLKLTPSEWCALLKAEMGLIRLVRRQKALLEQYPDGRTPIEEGYRHALSYVDPYTQQSVGGVFDGEDKKILTQYLQENGLSLSQNSDHLETILRFKEFMDERPAQSSLYSELEWLERDGEARGVPEASNANNKPRDYARGEWKTFLDPTTFVGDKRGLSQLSEIRRHHLVMAAFMDPKSRIQPPESTMEKLRRRFESASSSSHLVERKKISHERTMETLRRHPRLEFSTVVSENFLESVGIDCGVVPKGSAPGASLLTGTYSNFYVEHGLIDFANDYSDEVGYSAADTGSTVNGIGWQGQVHPDYIPDRVVVSEATIVGKDAKLPQAQERAAVDTMRVVIPNPERIAYAGEYLAPIGDSARNVEEAIDKWIQRPDFLDDVYRVRRFYEVLTRPGVIYEEIKSNPNYFNLRKELIIRLIENAKRENNHFRAETLYYFTTMIGYQFDLALKNGDLTQEQYAALINNWPTLNQEEGFNYLTTRLSNPQIATKERYELSSLLLMNFYMHPMANQPEQLFEPLDHDLIATLILSGGLLEIVADHVDIPINAKEGKTWVREQLIPFLLRKNPNELSLILESILKKHHSDYSIVQNAGWAPVEGHPRYFRKIVNGETFEIDLASMQVTKFRGAPLEGISTTLPVKVTSDLHYMTLFGTIPRTAIVQAGKEPGELVYTFDVPGKGRFRITDKAADVAIRIEREFYQDRGEPGERTVWFTYQKPNTPEDHTPYGLEEQLLDRGLFVHPKDQKMGFAFLETDKETGEFKGKALLRFDQKGHLKSAEVEGGKRIIHAPGAELEKAIAPLNTQQLLYLANPGEDWISEIRLTGLGLSLQREEEEGLWRLQGDHPLAGAELKIGHARSDPIKQLLHSLRGNFEQCGFVVHKDHKDFLVMWPHRIATEKAHKREEWEFEKLIQRGSPLILEVNDKGEIGGDSTALMNLAYLFAGRHDYDRAAYFISRAVAARIGNQEEIEALRELDGFFRTMPTHSMRSNGIALKGMLAIRRIGAEQIPESERTLAWEEFLSDASVISERAEGYFSALEHSPFQREGYAERLRADEKELTLTDVELAQLTLFQISAPLHKKGKKGLELSDFQRFMDSDDAIKIYGQDAIEELRRAVHHEKLEELAAKTEGILSFTTLVQEVERICQINLVDLLRMRANAGRMRRLEAPATVSPFVDQNPEVALEVRERVNFREDYFHEIPERQKTDQQVRISRMTTAMIRTLEKDEQGKPSPIEGVRKTEKEQLVQGIIESSSEILREIDQKRAISSDRLEPFSNAVNAERDFHKQESLRLRRELFGSLENHKAHLPKTVREALLRRGKLGDEPIWRALRKGYQMGELSTVPEIDGVMTRLLMHEASVKVLEGSVAQSLKELKNLQSDGVEESSAPWISGSTQLLMLIESALNHERYLEGGKLKNPPLHRKALVMEASKGIILTSEQLTLIEKIVNNPPDWYELKVGLGKTSVVLPLVLLLLIEKGANPTAVVKESLLKANLDSLDADTRELIEGAGVSFTFSINDTCSALSVQERYLRLLEVKSQKGYTVTTASSLQAIDHKLQLLRTKAREFRGEDRDLREIEQQLYYLGKIKGFFNLLVVDEVDDILDVTVENNVGLGLPAEFPIEIRKVLMEFFAAGMKALSSGNREEATLKTAELFQAMLNRNQAAIDPERVRKELLPAFVLVGLGDSEVQRALKLPDFLTRMLETDEGRQQLVGYFCESEGVELCSKKEWKKIPEETKRYLEALKHQVQQSLPIALNQNPGIDYGPKKDGFQIGPRVSGQEKEAIFGASHDILANHFVSYLSQIPNTLFFLRELKRMEEMVPPHLDDPFNYHRWKREADQLNETVIDWVNRPENWAVRLHLLEECVIGPKNIKIYERQIVSNSHNIAAGRTVIGLTGTCNRNALPSQQGAASRPMEAKKVTARVFLEAGLLGSTEVEVHEARRSIEKNPIFARLKAIIQSPEGGECRAIINQGFDLGVASTESVVAELRSEAGDRIFVYVDSTDRLFRIWYPDKDAPEMISKEALRGKMGDPDYRAKVLCYFAPPDTRGVDVPLPGGYAVAMVSEKCSEEDMVQLLGRMRGAGKTQCLKHLLISQAVADRISSRSGGEAQGIDYSKVIEDILYLSAPSKGSKALKAGIESFKRVTTMGVSEILDTPLRARLSDEERLIRSRLGEVADQWLYESKGVDFEADRAPLNWEDVRAFGKKAYQNEKLKLRTLEETLRQLPINEGNIKAYRRKIGKKLQELENAWNAFKSQVKAEHPVVPTAVPSLSGGLPVMSAQVQEQQQVQQQQMQQVVSQREMTQEKTEKQSVIEELYRDYDKFDSTNLSSALGLLNNALYTNKLKFDLTKDEEKALSAFWALAGINVSPRVVANLILLGGFKGNLMNCRVFVRQSKPIPEDELESIRNGMNNPKIRIWNPFPLEVSLISVNDYHFLTQPGERFDKDKQYPFEPHIAKKMHVWQDSSFQTGVIYTEVEEQGAVYTAVPTHLYPETGGFILNQGIPCDSDPQVRKKLLLAKLFMGVSEFTAEEELMLKEELTTIFSRAIPEEEMQIRTGLLVHVAHFGGGLKQQELVERLLA